MAANPNTQQPEQVAQNEQAEQDIQGDIDRFNNEMSNLLNLKDNQYQIKANQGCITQNKDKLLVDSVSAFTSRL